MVRLVKIAILSFYLFQGLCQDVSFSQFNGIAPYYNPAFTSAFSGNFRVSVVHRNQWIGLQEQPLTSFCISGDIKFDLKFQDYKGDYFGAGIYFITDRSQLYDWNANEIALLLSYHKLLEGTNRNYLSAGIGVGVTQRSINYDNIYFEDQFDGLNKYNGQTSELLPPNIFARPEFKFGIHHNTSIGRKWRTQYGLSLHHLFSPDVSFYKDFDNSDYIGSRSLASYSKFIALVNFIYHSSSSLDLYPRFFLSAQGPHQIFQTGISLRKAFYTLNQTAFHAGVNTRIIKNFDSYTPSDLGVHLGFEIKNFIIGFHYDLGIKDAVKYSAPTHSFEISLALIGNFDNDGYICPSF